MLYVLQVFLLAVRVYARVEGFELKINVSTDDISIGVLIGSSGT